MGGLINLVGKRFGKLTVIERAGSTKGGVARWLARCDCGNEIIVDGSSLRRNNGTKSCGCLKNESAAKHRMTDTKVYKTWLNIKQRCLNPNCECYKDYGARGIKIAPEWEDDFSAFYNFVSKLEHFGDKIYSLDRIDNDGDYCPGNVRWADNKIQARNKRNNIVVEYNGVEMCLKDASKASGIPYPTLQSRYYAGDRGDYLFRPVTEDSITGAKLSKEDVIKIRQLYATGEFSQRRLAENFKVSRALVGLIVNYKIWKNEALALIEVDLEGFKPDWSLRDE